jgi:ribosomal protein L37E
MLICNDCGQQYDQDRNECPDCGDLEADLVGIGGGPGRFWGYRGLRPVLAVRQVTSEVGIAAGRVLRRWYRAKGLTKQVTVTRGTGVDYAEGIKFTDPRRMAVYFAKYGTSGSKEYQHQVPQEWITSYLVCEDCGREYDQARDECPDCGCPEAELVDTGSGGRFWGDRGLRRCSQSARSPQLWGSPLGPRGLI